MKNKISVSILTIIFALGCSPEATKLQIPQYIAPEQKQEPDTNLFEEGAASDVDLVFVVDNSGSMQTHQSNLISNVGQFVTNFSSLAKLNYHIGVITTDDGNLNSEVSEAFVTPSTANGLDVLKRALNVGTFGGASEAVFDPLIESMTAPNINGRNKGFYRQDAYLVVIFVTDAEDQSSANSALTTWQKLVAMKGGDESKVLLYGVVVPSNNSLDCDRDDGTRPRRLEEFLRYKDPNLANELHLCSPTYGTDLGNLGTNIAENLVARVMYLSKAPIVSTIEVSFGTQIIYPDSQTGWSYDPAKNAIFFGKKVQWSKQPKDTKVKIKYQAAHYDDEK